MRYLLSDIECISKEAIEKFAKVGIHDTDQLLEKAFSPNQRAILSKNTDLSKDDLKAWAGVSDLLRVKGIGLRYAELFVSAGIATTVQELGHLDIDNDYNKLKEEINQNNSSVSLPPRLRFKELLEEARELRPRIIINSHSLTSEEKNDFNNGMTIEFRNKRLKLNKVFLFTFALSIFLIAIIFIVDKIKFSDFPYQDSELGRLFEEVGFLPYYMFHTSVFILAIIIHIFSYIVFFFKNFINNLINYIFFNWSTNYLCLEEFSAISDSDTRFRVKENLAILLMLVTFAGYSYYQIYHSGLTLPEALLSHKNIYSAFGILMGVAGVFSVISDANTRELFQIFGKKTAVFRNFLITIMVQQVIFVLSFLLIIPSLSLIIFPTWDTINKTYVIPHFEKLVNEKRDVIEELNFQNDADIQYQQGILNYVDDIVTPVVKNGITLDFKAGKNAILVFFTNSLIAGAWIFTVYFAAYIIIPYLVFGGWLKGLVYLFIIFISYVSEDVLINFIPEGYNLKSGTLIYGILLVFFIYANALLFDWLYDTATSTQKRCINCEVVLDKESEYCLVCGFEQRLVSGIH